MNQTKTPNQQQIIEPTNGLSATSAPNRLLRAGAVASTLLLASCGIFSGADKDQSHSSTTHSEAVGDNIGSFTANPAIEELASDIERVVLLEIGSETDRDTDTSVEQFSKDIMDPELRTLAVDYLELERADDMPTYDDTKARAVAHSIKNPEIHALAVRKRDTALAASIKGFDVKTEKAAIATISDTTIRAKAQRLSDLSIAERIVVADTTEAQEMIDAIADPDIKAWAVRKYDYELSGIAMNGSMLEEDTKAALDAIVSSDIKQKAQANYRNTLGYEAAYELQDEKYNFESFPEKAYEVYNELSKVAEEAKSAVFQQRFAKQQEIDNMITAKLESLAVPIDVPDRVEKQRFNERAVVRPLVELSQAQKDAIVEYADSENDDFTEEPDVRFAEISVDQDGTFGLHFPEDGLDAKTKQQLQTVFHNAEPYVSAAFKNGKLSMVRFIVGEFNPYYSRLKREIVIQIPAGETSEVSMDQLSSAFLHETIHALTSGKTTGETLTKQEFNDFSNVCSALAEQAVDKFDSLTYGMEDDFSVLRKYLPKDQQPVVDTLIKAAKEGTLKDYVYKDSAYVKGLGLPFHCTMPTFVDVLQSVARETGVSLELNDKFAEEKDIQKLYKEWESASQYLALQNQIDESNFVQTEDWIGEYLGHSNDNGAELMATFMNALIYYEPAAIETLKGLSDDVQITAIDLMRKTIDMIVSDNPELAGTLADLEAHILDGMHR